MEKIILRQVRDIGDSISTTFSFIGKNSQTLFQVFAFYLAAPVLILSIITGIGTMQLTAALGDVILYPNDLDPTVAMEAILTQFSNPLILISIVLSILIMIVFVAVVYKSMHLYDTNKGVINVADIKRGLAKDSGRLFLGTIVLILFGLILIFCVSLLGTLAGSFLSPFISIFLIFIPLIYTIIACTLVYPIMIVEEANIIMAIQRSFSLISNNWWRTFGFLFLLSIILGMILLVVRIPLSFLFGALLPMIGFENASIASGVTSAFMTIINFVIYLFQFVAIGVWYYNLVEQKEGTQLLETLDEIGEEEKPNLDYFR